MQVGVPKALAVGQLDRAGFPLHQRVQVVPRPPVQVVRGVFRQPPPRGQPRPLLGQPLSARRAVRQLARQHGHHVGDQGQVRGAGHQVGIAPGHVVKAEQQSAVGLGAPAQVGRDRRGQPPVDVRLVTVHRAALALGVGDALAEHLALAQVQGRGEVGVPPGRGDLDTEDWSGFTLDRGADGDREVFPGAAGHRVPTGFNLPALAPFVRLGERIEATTTISTDDRTWLLERLAELRERYTALPPGLPRGVVHGDAWRGNIARTGDGRTILLDLESCALGPPEWDLTSTAVSRVTTGWLDAGEWADYSAAYDLDVTTWTGFDVLRDIRELRMTSMACQVAATDPERYGQQAAHRLACLRGRRGSRPWPGWEAVP